MVASSANTTAPESLALDATSKSKSSTTKPAKQSKGFSSYDIYIVDGSKINVQIEKTAIGKALFDKVVENLNILEKDYFGLSFYTNTGFKNWLQLEKQLYKQLRKCTDLLFEVKFYPPEPGQLHEDITRYYLCLQVQNDIASGKLSCSPVTHALLGSYVVQAQLGDYDPQTNGPPENYLSEFRFAPEHTQDLLSRICELHKTHKGQTPSEADSHYLENAKKLALYGIDLHKAKDSDNVDVGLAVCSSGILVYREKLRINRLAWPKILKISYRSNNFYVKIRPGEFEQRETILGFKFPNSKAAKNFWKTCVENHAFFRLMSPEPVNKKGLLNFGSGSSRFRFSGRTQYQSRLASGLIQRPEPGFQRSVSSRFPVKQQQPQHQLAANRLSSDYKPAADLNSPLKFVDASTKEARSTAVSTPNLLTVSQVSALPYDKSPDDTLAYDVALASAVSPAERQQLLHPRTQVGSDSFYSENQKPARSDTSQSTSDTSRSSTNVEYPPKNERVVTYTEENVNIVQKPQGTIVTTPTGTTQQQMVQGKIVHSEIVEGFHPITTLPVKSPQNERESQNRFSNQKGASLKLDQSGLTEHPVVEHNGFDDSYRPSNTPPYVSPKNGPRTVSTVVTNEESVHNVPAQKMSIKTPDGAVTTTTTASQIKTVKQTIQTNSFETFCVPAAVINSNNSPSENFVHREITKESTVLSSASNNKPPTIVSKDFQQQRFLVNRENLSAISGDEEFTLPPDAVLVSREVKTENGRTVETITYKLEKDGSVQTFKEQRVTVRSNNIEIDHDQQLSAAILEATMMNPNMTVEKVELRRAGGGQTDL